MGGSMNDATTIRSGDERYEAIEAEAQMCGYSLVSEGDDQSEWFSLTLNGEHIRWCGSVREAAIAMVNHYQTGEAA